MYDVWYPRYKVWWTEIFVILGHFCPFTPPNHLENQKKNYLFIYLFFWGGGAGHIILHTCTIDYNHDVWLLRYGAQQTEFKITNNNYMMHGSWDRECNRIFCHFGPFFYPFTPLATQKIEILQKLETHLEIL